MDKFEEQRAPARGSRQDTGAPPHDVRRRPQRGGGQNGPERREWNRRGFERRQANPPQQTKPRGNDPAWHRDVGQPAIRKGPDTARLFVALALPDEAIEEIGTFINSMPTMAAGNVRWIPRENVHLTLMFLGDTSAELQPQVREQLSAAASNTSPFRLKLGETGAFPSFHSPKILWIGLDGEVRKLMQLQGRVEGALRTIGFEPEHRAFRPHITVGRTVRDLSRQYEGDVGFSWRRSVLPAKRAEVPVSEIRLLRSRLRPEGAVYEKVFSAPLGH